VESEGQHLGRVDRRRRQKAQGGRASAGSEVDKRQSDKFATKYPSKILGALFKNDPSGVLNLGKAGTLSMTVNGLNVVVLPRA